MSMNEQKILHKLAAYKRKYFLYQFAKGTLKWMLVVSLYLFIVLTMEHRFRFGSLVRGGMYFGWLLTFIFCGMAWLLPPLYKLLFPKRGLSHYEASRRIGLALPTVNDKLTNWLALLGMQKGGNRALVQASLNRRASFLKQIPFAKTISAKDNKKFLVLLAPLLLLATGAWTFFPETLSQTSERIIQYQNAYTPPAPFSFSLQNEPLETFAYEPFKLSVELSGKKIPKKMYIIAGMQRRSFQKVGDTQFVYTMRPLTKDIAFHLEGDGHKSRPYLLKVKEKPTIQQAQLLLRYPPHTQREDEAMDELKNLFIPEGTYVIWRLQTTSVDKIAFEFGKENKLYSSKKEKNKLFIFKKRFLYSETYTVHLESESVRIPKTDLLQYSVGVIKDEHPSLTLEVFVDPLLYDFVILAGKAVDDYGITALNIKYKETSVGDASVPEQTLAIPLANKKSPLQPFYFKWDVSVEAGEVLSYCVEAWDNDSVNGRKRTRSAWHAVHIPTEKKLKEVIEEDTSEVKDKIVESLTQTGNLKEEIKKTEEALKLKSEFGWGDKKSIQGIIKRQMEREEELKALQQSYKTLSERINKFNEQQPRYKEKMAAMQRIFDEVMTDETKALYEELQLMIQERAQLNEVQKVVEKLSVEEDFFEKELSRALALFKHLQFEFNLNEALERVKELREQQAALSQDVEGQLEEQARKQADLSEHFDEIKEKLKTIEDLNNTLDTPYDLGDLTQDIQSISQAQEAAKKALEAGKRGKARKAQKAAQEGIKSLQKKLESLQKEVGKEGLTINEVALRIILTHLVDLSFLQEDLIVQYRETTLNTPADGEVSAKQFDMKEAAKGPLGALQSLAEEMVEVQSVITREIHNAHQRLDRVIDALRIRDRRGAAVAQNEVMTSFNELGVLLSDLLAQAKENDKQGKGGIPSLSEWQRQLREQIKQLKGGKEPRAKGLVEAIAKQESIRQRLQEMMRDSETMGSKARRMMQSLINEMERAEEALANDNINRDFIRRQARIERHLLEVEHSLQKSGTKEEREAASPGAYEQILPPSFEEYKKLKEKELELYRYAPMKMHPYYEREVEDYFRKMGEKLP